MHKYQKLHYVALTILLGVSASASAMSFPQDYLNTNQSFETSQIVVAESNKVLSVTEKSHSSPQHIHQLSVFGKKPETAETKGKTIEMTDAKSISNFHLFEQYL